MNPVAKAVLVPPRPNLGPEPMSRRQWTPGVLLVLLAVAAWLALILFGIRRTRGRHRHRQRRSDRVESDRLEMPAGPFLSRREQMAACSAAVRAALAGRFGAQWQARTTEEIASDRALAEALGPEPAMQLVQFLARADRAKFDYREGLQSPLPDAVPGWLAGFVASSVPAAGARSKITGK